MKNGVLSNFTRSHISSDRVRSGYEINSSTCSIRIGGNNKAFNLACRAELGRIPLILPINKKIMKYFVQLNNKNNASIAKQALLMSKNLHSINNSGFYSNFMNMIEHYHSSNLDLESFDNDTVRRYLTYMKEKYIYISGDTVFNFQRN